MIGKMRHRVTIQQQSQAQDSHGQETEVWADVETVWASVRPVSGREFFAASGERSDITHEILLRYEPTLTPRHRIVYDGRIFDVVAVLNSDERDRFLDVKAIEHAP